MADEGRVFDQLHVRLISFTDVVVPTASRSRSSSSGTQQQGEESVDDMEEEGDE